MYDRRHISRDSFFIPMTRPLYIFFVYLIQYELGIKLYFSGFEVRLSGMNQRKEETSKLLNVLKELERDEQYWGLKQYVRNLKLRSSLNGKKKFILRGSSARLNRLQADRRSKTLGLVEFVPYDEREDMYEDVIVQTDYRAWDRTVLSFYDSR